MIAVKLNPAGELLWVRNFGSSEADTVLRDRDRVEIYRPLIADPKDVRRKRAEEGKVMKKGGGPAEDAAG